ncbi:hypothetical protein BDF22DRAFT_667160 [Syncephalis plumigaleata]|nr:hypothetical protein BDF22DRAFT_667160 [Syncephalis plumigaleata]
MTTTNTEALLVLQKENGTFECTKTDWTTKAFLLSLPRGAYTGARTLDHATRVVDLETHIIRIAHSFQSIDFVNDTATHGGKRRSINYNHDSTTTTTNTINTSATHVERPESPWMHASLASYRNPNELRKLIMPGLALGLDEFRRIFHLDDRTSMLEAKITILIPYPVENELPRIHIHLCPLHMPNDIPCRVKIFGAPRHHPSIKDSLWVRERELHESLKGSNTNEIVLCDNTHHTIYEGTSSNFFAVISSTSTSTSNNTNLSLVTAPHEHVLRGTIMRMVEEICKELSIPIQYRFATIDEARTGQWRGAFLTSTSRLVLPIRWIDFYDER